MEALAKLDRAAQARAVAQLADDLRDLGSSRSYEASLLLPRLANGTDAAVAVLRDQVRDGDEIKRAIAMILLEPFGEPAAPAAPTLMHGHHRAGRRPQDSPGLPHGLVGDRSAGRKGGDASRRRFRPRDQSARGLGRRALRPRPEGHGRGGRASGDPRADRGARRSRVGDDDRKRGAIVALGEFGPRAAGAIPALVERDPGAGEDPSRTLPGPDDHANSPGALATAALGKIGSEGNPEAWPSWPACSRSRDGPIRA